MKEESLNQVLRVFGGVSAMPDELIQVFGLFGLN
jgi:hypothetical protein